MNIKFFLKKLGLRISPVYRKLDAVQQRVFALTEQQNTMIQSNAVKLDILDAPDDFGYAIRLDYLPSRDLSPRWGYSAGPMPGIKEWFDSYAEEYKEMLRYMRRLPVEHISKTFVHGGG